MAAHLCAAFLRDKGLPGLLRGFSGGESLTAVFRPGGRPIDPGFYRGADWSWRDRLAFAEQLLHRALLLRTCRQRSAVRRCWRITCGWTRGKTHRPALSHTPDGGDERARAGTAGLRPRAQDTGAPLPAGGTRSALQPPAGTGISLSIVPLYAGWHRAVGGDYLWNTRRSIKKNAFKRWFAFLWKT